MSTKGECGDTCRVIFSINFIHESITKIQACNYRAYSLLVTSLLSEHNTFLTLNVRIGHNWKTGFLGSRLISRVKVDNTNYNQHFIKPDEDSNSHLKTIFWNQDYKRSSFYIKTLDRFQDNVRFSIFKHILNLNHGRVFDTLL